MANRPVAEIELSEDLVRSLLREQAPDFADQPIEVLARGWDNTNFRLGPNHILRLPHRAVAADLVLLEQRWLPEIAGRVDLGLPVPTIAGIPSSEYPWPWSIVPWFAGVDAADAPLTDPAQTAVDLGRFFAQLHVPAPADAPVNPYRGCPLADRGDRFATNLLDLGGAYDQAAVQAVFDEARDVPGTTERVWLHGDLHTRNMVVGAGRLTAIIDWGDVCVGDRATDLAGAFMLVPDHLTIVKEHAGASEADWQRARGWAANFAAMYLAHSDDDPVMRRMGERLLATILAG